jgi:hypothetical protein
MYALSVNNAASPNDDGINVSTKSSWNIFLEYPLTTRLQNSMLVPVQPYCVSYNWLLFVNRLSVIRLNRPLVSIPLTNYDRRTLPGVLAAAVVSRRLK